MEIDAKSVHTPNAYFLLQCFNDCICELFFLMVKIFYYEFEKLVYAIYLHILHHVGQREVSFIINSYIYILYG